MSAQICETCKNKDKRCYCAPNSTCSDYEEINTKHTVFDKFRSINMEDYELTIGTIENYKIKACELVENDCSKCEAKYEACGRPWCCFDTTIRFIKYANKYNVQGVVL